MNCFHSPALDHTNKERLENHRGGGGGGTQRTNKSEQKMSEVSRIVPGLLGRSLCVKIKRSQVNGLIVTCLVYIVCRGRFRI